jgi:hypothetical protein
VVGPYRSGYNVPISKADRVQLGRSQVALDDGKAKTPGDFLKSIKGKPVVVKLNSGVDYRGELPLS